MKTVTLSIVEKSISLVLRDGEVSIGHDAWIDQNNLLEKFFPRLNELLESNSLSQEDIGEYKLETDLPTGYTMARIAQTLIATLNFALEE